MPRVHLLRVFCDEDGSGGNPLAVFLEGAEVPAPERQRVAAELGLSETVFVDDPGRGRLRIYTPTVELDFAGHPTVGSAWLLARQGAPVPALHVPAGELGVRYADDATFVSARPRWAPPFTYERLPDPAAVDALEGPPGGHDLISAWAWISEQAGTVRARVFCDRLGIPEDEATGAAAVRLCALLGRSIDVHQGRGSRIAAHPRARGTVELGGRVELDEVRDHRL